MKRATTYKRGEKVILHSLSKTVAGVWVLSEPVLTCGVEDVSLLGEYVCKVLDASREGVPHPTAWRQFDVVLQIAGVKSKSSFIKSAKCVDIKLQDSNFCFIPTKNSGDREGFKHLEDNALRLSSDMRHQLGEQLIAAFERST